MRSQLAHLTIGELKRLNKYGVTTISVIVAIMWFLMLFFIDDQEMLGALLPFVIVIDATMMSVIYIGAVMFFEKTEKTISTLLVTPVKKSELIISKVIANTIAQTLSTLVIVIVFYFVRQVEVNWIVMILTLIISISFHSLLGFVFSYHSKDFTSMLVNLMTYTFLLTIPSVLYSFNILLKGDIWRYILIITPTQSVFNLIAVSFGGQMNIDFFLSLGLLISLTIFGYIYYVLPQFKIYAIKESGV
jgi:fluoroquinolone transport system permease protein